MPSQKTRIYECPHCWEDVVMKPDQQDKKLYCPHCNEPFELEDGVMRKVKPLGKPFLLFVLLVSLVFSLYIFYPKIRRLFITEKIIEKVQEVHKNVNHDQEELLKLAKAIDVNNPVTMEFALKLAKLYPGKYNLGQVCLLHQYIVKNWKYVNDPRGINYVRSASATIKNDLTGDCDDFAVLISACVESIGGQTRITYGQNKNGGHAFTEVYCGNDKKEFAKICNAIRDIYGQNYNVSYNVDNKGGFWVNMDWFGVPQHVGAEYYAFESRTIFYPLEKKPYFTKN